MHLGTFKSNTDADRETVMEAIEKIRVQGIYPHPPEDCTAECRDRGNSLVSECSIHATVIYFVLEFLGCGTLWVTDGIWKLTFPHCMHRVKQGMHDHFKNLCNMHTC